MGLIERSGFRRVDHIGVIVADLDDQKRWLGSVLGLPVTREIDSPQMKLKAIFYRCGDVDIEIIQLTDAEARRHRLGESNRARIEHIAIEVADVQAVMETLAPLGVRTTGPAPRRTGDRLSVWTVAETTGGVSYQFTQRV